MKPSDLEEDVVAGRVVQPEIPLKELLVPGDSGRVNHGSVAFAPLERRERRASSSIDIDSLVIPVRDLIAANHRPMP